MSSASSNYNYVDNKGNKILIYPAINPEIVTYITKVENEKEKTEQCDVNYTFVTYKKRL